MPTPSTMNSQLIASKAVFWLLLLFFSFPAFSQAKRDAAALGIPYERYEVADQFGRKITFYLSPAVEATTNYPLAVFIQGSGCDSLFVKMGENVGGGMQNLLLQVIKGRARVLVVEKPGVTYLDQSKQPGAAEGCRAEFLQEHTLERWAEAVNAALKAAHKLPQVGATKTLVAGHSEGGIVAARVAALNAQVTHVASLAGGGPTQLFDLVEIARGQMGATAANGDPGEMVLAEWKKMQADPDSTTKFFFGHPYRRWTSFLQTSVLKELSQSKARVYLAQGTKDQSVLVTGVDVLRAELVVQGRDLTVERLVGADHAFGREAGSPEGLKSVLSHVATWYLGKPNE